ncbi:hypothetical protein SAMN04488047_1607, partial [Tranquillimonas alkanivorans]
KWQSDPLIVWIAVGGMAAVFAFERAFLRRAGARPHQHEA